MIKVCVSCHKEFNSPRSHYKFCSNGCWKKSHIGNSHIDIWGYKVILQPDHPCAQNRGYILEHRLVMMNHLGRLLSSQELVHHINGNKLDNRIENLQVISRKDIGGKKLNAECPKCHHKFGLY